MVAYEFYWRDHKGNDNLIGILPERRENSERITQESIINWARKIIGGNTELKDISFIQIEIDEAQIESLGLNPDSELRKKSNQ